MSARGEPWTARRNHDHAWLEKKEAEQKRAEAGIPILCTWALVFLLKKRPESESRASWELPGDVCEVLERLLSAGLHVHHQLTPLKDKLFLIIGATPAVLLDEASEHMRLMCAVQGPRPLRGCIPFHSSLAEQLTPVGAPFRFTSGQQQKIVMHRMKRAAGVDPFTRMLAPSAADLLASATKILPMRWKTQHMLEAYGCTVATSNMGRAKHLLPKVWCLQAMLLPNRA